MQKDFITYSNVDSIVRGIKNIFEENNVEGKIRIAWDMASFEKLYDYVRFCGLDVGAKNGFDFCGIRHSGLGGKDGNFFKVWVEKIK